MPTTTSRDGTTIAFERSGQGPALILVDGALMHRALDEATAQLVELLAPHLTVLRYDRRGRGESTDGQPFALQREIEDIEALITEAGGSASLYGISSGAALAMEAAIALPGKVEKLVMYEAPYNSDEAAREAWREYRRRLEELLAAGRRGDAVVLFATLVGMPAEQADEMRRMPTWPAWEAVAPTLAYDAAALGDDASVPVERAHRVAMPALIMAGGETYPFMHDTARALTAAMPHAEYRVLEGQTHEVSPEALAPVLIEFLTAQPAAVGAAHLTKD